MGLPLDGQKISLDTGFGLPARVRLFISLFGPMKLEEHYKKKQPYIQSCEYLLLSPSEMGAIRSALQRESL